MTPVDLNTHFKRFKVQIWFYYSDFWDFFRRKPLSTVPQLEIYEKVWQRWENNFEYSRDQILNFSFFSICDCSWTECSNFGIFDKMGSMAFHIFSLHLREGGFCARCKIRLMGHWNFNERDEISPAPFTLKALGTIKINDFHVISALF